MKKLIRYDLELECSFTTCPDRSPLSSKGPEKIRAASRRDVSSLLDAKPRCAVPSHHFLARALL